MGGLGGMTTDGWSSWETERWTELVSKLVEATSHVTWIIHHLVGGDEEIRTTQCNVAFLVL